MKSAYITSDVSEQEPGSKKRLQQYESEKSSPQQTRTSSVVDFCEGEVPFSSICKKTSTLSDSPVHQSFPEKIICSEEEASLKAQTSSAHSASAFQCNDSRIHQSFPEKLMAMLAHEEFSDSIRWLPHGKTFEILNTDKLHSKVLPLFFKHCKYKSFTRKLYRWGFRQITKGPDANSFFNENFSRDSARNISKMHCHYSQKELRTRNQNVKYAPLSEYSSISSPQSPNYSGSRAQSPSRSNLNLPSMQDSQSSLHKVSTSDLSNLHSTSMDSIPSTNFTFPLLPSQPFFPTQNIIQPSITSQCGNLELMLSAVIANMNLQQHRAISQLAQMKVQESKARLIAGLKASRTASISNDNRATLQPLLCQLHETE